MLHDSIKSKGFVLAIVVALFCFCVYLLQRVFSGELILPQVLRLGPLTVRYYGLIMALAAAFGFWSALRRAPQFGVEPRQAEDVLFWIIIGGFIGARLYHVLSSADYYWQHPLDIIKVWNGGLSIYGAVLGGVISLILYRIVSRVALDTLAILDWLAPCVLLGQIIGRFGNLFNYEAFGYPTNLPWKMFVPAQFRPEMFMPAAFFHPWFLYEALGNIFILIFLLKMEKNQKLGVVAFCYLLLYNLLRFCLEFLRIDSTFVGAFRLNALVSLALALVGFCALLYLRRDVPKS